MNETVNALNALSIFGPGQAGAYREHASEVRAVLGDDISTKAQDHVKEWAAAGEPGTLILTGNAGTGKTALVDAYCGELQAETPTNDGVQEIKEARFVVKDLSGVPEAERSEVLQLERDLRLGNRDGQLFLCANEGVLRDALEGASIDGLGEILDHALEQGVSLLESKAPGTAILNMNRQRWTGEELWPRLVDYLVREELWGDCEGCGASVGCPMRANAEALRREGPREAARRLIQLASGGSVATLRELLAILANSVTGGLSCSDVERANSEFTAANGYFNLFFGENLDRERIERSHLLQGVREAAVGSTADVEVDGWLRDSGNAPTEVRALAAPSSENPHARVQTAVGVMTFGELGETVTVSDDAARVDECMQDFAKGRDFLGLWRRRVFFEAQAFLGGRSGAFRRLTVFSYYGELLDLADSLDTGRDTAEERQRLIVGLNYLAAGFHAFGGHLVVPDSGSLAARNPGSFRPPAPSLVHSQLPVDGLTVRLHDSEELRDAIDTDNVRVVMDAVVGQRNASLVLTPRLFQAIRDSAEFRAPVGSDIPEMTELSSFYAALASEPVAAGLNIVDPVREVIRPVTLPTFDL
jgi:hypothetical protein